MDHPVIGIIANPHKRDAAELSASLAKRLTDAGAEVVCDDETAALGCLKGEGSRADVAARASMIAVLGGDGTILHVVRELGEHVKPLAALNIGRLGFLTTATAPDIDQFVQALVSGTCRISERTLVLAQFTTRSGEKRSGAGLNEITLSRGANARMIHLEVRIDSELVNRYSGDGLIVSTPTGSTAYNLSAGGPIVEPQAGVFCVTPICPHVLSNRTFITSDRSVLQITPINQTDDLLLNVDGAPPCHLSRTEAITLRRAPWKVPLVYLPDSSFCDVLRQKMHWSGSSLQSTPAETQFSAPSI